MLFHKPYRYSVGILFHLVFLSFFMAIGQPVFYLGIDPDVDKSGVCLWNKKARKIEMLTNFKFPILLEYLQKYQNDHGKDFRVVIEAGWLNKSNWHRVDGASSNYNTKIGEHTGANFQVGKLLFEMCEHYGIDAILVKPKTRKLNSDQFKRFTGYDKPTNQEKRDACMLVFGF